MDTSSRLVSRHRLPAQHRGGIPPALPSKQAQIPSIQSILIVPQDSLYTTAHKPSYPEDSYSASVIYHKPPYQLSSWPSRSTNLSSTTAALSAARPSTLEPMTIAERTMLAIGANSRTPSEASLPPLSEIVQWHRLIYYMSFAQVSPRIEFQWQAISDMNASVTVSRNSESACRDHIRTHADASELTRQALCTLHDFLDFLDRPAGSMQD
ncbi:hypothetical protein CHU98_g3740 [Xylaria longipes]|nr:hypothetical protein CHU98_g3740 [Xylaria longipes]